MLKLADKDINRVKNAIAEIRQIFDFNFEVEIMAKNSKYYALVYADFGPERLNGGTSDNCIECNILAEGGTIPAVLKALIRNCQKYKKAIPLAQNQLKKGRSF